MYVELVHLLFSQLAVGGLVCILPVPDTAGKRFFRFCGLLSAAMLGLSLWSTPGTVWSELGRMPADIRDSWRPAASLLLMASALLSIGFVAAVMAERHRLKRTLLPAASVCGTAGVLLDSVQAAAPGMGVWAPVIYGANGLASALFLGSVVYAMILGHWYLVVPSLPNRPLETLARIIVATTALKALTMGVAFALFWFHGGPEIRMVLLRFLRFEDLFFVARVLFGLLGPGILAYMIWETVRIHSTQSATGLLYVATSFVLIGQAFSGYLSYTTSLPV